MLLPLDFSCEVKYLLMLLEIFIFTLFGIAVGIFTGLAPGIHVNTVAAFVLANQYAIGTSDLNLCIFIVSLTIAHAVLDFIPSVFLGIPSEDVHSVLPGHKLAKEGRGIEAIKITSLGSIIGCAILLGLLPILFWSVPFIFKIIKPAIPFILISILLLMIFIAKKNFWKAIIIIILASLFGIVTLDQGEKVLYSAFTGMFGISSMLFSLNQSTNFPEQKNSSISLNQKEILHTSFISFISSSFLSLIPAIGSSQAATVSQTFSKRPESFLLSLGVINACVGIVSIISLVLIGKARSGAGVVIEELIGSVSAGNTVIFAIVALLSALLSSSIAIWMSRKYAPYLMRINYRVMSIIIIIFLVALGFYFDGFNGLLNLFIATLIGYLTIYFGVNRSLCMSYLMIPTLGFYLNFI